MAVAPSLKHHGAENTVAPSPPPGFETPPIMATAEPLCEGEGDDLLDALLGLEVADTPSTSFKGDTETAIGTRAKATQRYKGHTRLTDQNVEEAKSSGLDQSRLEEDGDSALDALLGLDKALEEDVPSRKDNQSWGLEPYGEASSRDELDLLGGGGAVAREGVVTADAGVESEVGERSTVSPPFDGAELGRLCTHLNDRNRRAKRLAQRCQEMFLSLFFKVRVGVVLDGEEGGGGGFIWLNTSWWQHLRRVFI